MCQLVNDCLGTKLKTQVFQATVTPICKALYEGKGFGIPPLFYQETAPGEGQKDGALMYQLNYFTNPDGVVQKGCVIIRHGAELLLLETPEERSQAGLREKHGHKPVFALVVKGKPQLLALRLPCKGPRVKMYKHDSVRLPCMTSCAWRLLFVPCLSCER